MPVARSASLGSFAEGSPARDADRRIHRGAAAGCFERGRSGGDGAACARGADQPMAASARSARRRSPRSGDESDRRAGVRPLEPGARGRAPAFVVAQSRSRQRRRSRQKVGRRTRRADPRLHQAIGTPRAPGADVYRGGGGTVRGRCRRRGLRRAAGLPRAGVGDRERRRSAGTNTHRSNPDPARRRVHPRSGRAAGSGRAGAQPSARCRGRPAHQRRRRRDRHAAGDRSRRPAGHARSGGGIDQRPPASSRACGSADGHLRGARRRVQRGRPPPRHRRLEQRENMGGIDRQASDRAFRTYRHDQRRPLQP